jgi:hypothetical protein
VVAGYELLVTLSLLNIQADSLTMTPLFFLLLFSPRNVKNGTGVRLFAFNKFFEPFLLLYICVKRERGK